MPGTLETETAQQTPESAELSAVLRKISWRLIPFMFVLYIMSYLDRINVSFAMLQMKDALQFTDLIFGFGSGVFFLGYCVFGIPSNLMVERMGARRWISVIMVIWGALSVAIAAIKTAEEFYILRFLLGVAEAGFFPGMILYLTYWFPKKQHGKAVSRFMSAIPAAGVIGSLTANKALDMHGVCGMDGWQWLFIVTGMPSVILGVAVWFVLTDGPALAKWLTPDEKATLSDAIETDKRAAAVVVDPDLSTTAPVSKWTNIRAVLINKLVWSFALCYFCLTVAMYGFQLWLPQIIKNLGDQPDTVTALLSAIPAVFQALGIILIGASSDKTGDRRFHMALSALIGAVGFAGTVLLGGHPVLQLACLCMTAFGIWGTVGPFWACATSTVSGATAATAIGLINSIGNLGGFAGPYFVGFIKTYTHDFGMALYTLCASLVLSGVLFLLVTRTRRPV